MDGRESALQKTLTRKQIRSDQLTAVYVDNLRTVRQDRKKTRRSDFVLNRDHEMSSTTIQPTAASFRFEVCSADFANCFAWQDANPFSLVALIAATLQFRIPVVRFD